MANTTILAIDQGTSSSRAIIFDKHGKPLAQASKEFSQIYPQNGWVEHNPEEIWSSTLEVCQTVLETYPTPIALGITNQRETTVIWERDTGKIIYNAIVWQDRRTSKYCEKLKQDGHEATIIEKTGLILDPYFSATKIAWILDNVDGARQAAESGKLAFGTIDSFLLWRLTEGKIHATDATNASRTMLYNIHTNQWDEALLSLFNVPKTILPEVCDCAYDFGVTSVFKQPILISAIAGDQQSAMVGQACFTPGMIKSTYGTGCFVMVNTGEKIIDSSHRLLSTIAYRLSGKTTYGLEGSIFIAGAAVQWIRDNLKLIQSASQTETIAASIPDNNGVYLVPAFTGLGAPYWNPDARAALFGMKRDTGVEEIVRATLESVCYQTHDLLNAMASDGIHPTHIRVDGGMVANNWLMQFLADILNIQVDRPVVEETTALGVAYLAGLQQGIFSSLEDISQCWQQEHEFSPNMAEKGRVELISHWQQAIASTQSFSTN